MIILSFEWWMILQKPWVLQSFLWKFLSLAVSFVSGYVNLTDSINFFSQGRLSLSIFLEVLISQFFFFIQNTLEPEFLHKSCIQNTLKSQSRH